MKPEERRKVEELKKQNEEVKAWLRRYRNAKLYARRMREEAAELISAQESVGAINYDGMPHGSAESDLSSMFAARETMREKLARAEKRMAETYMEIVEAIHELPSQAEIDIMSMRYIELDGFKERSMEEIADRINYHPSRVKSLHAAALTHLAPTVLKPQEEKDDTK